MKIRVLFSAAALLLVMAFSSQSARADFWGPFPVYTGGYIYYSGDYPPATLLAPNGYYGCRAGCCRQAVWRGGHWRNVITCPK